MITFPAGEAPKYATLRLGIERFYAALQPPLETLRRRCFNDLAFPDPGKAAADEEPFTYTDAHEAIIDEAVDLFLNEVAGTERTAAGFTAGSGVLQRQDLQLFSTGIQRGAALLDAAVTFRGDRESPAVRQMLDSAFKRLSERGTLRLEGIRDDIHGILVGAQEAGISPLETGRQLAAQFDEYAGYEFERLARTEAAFAAEAGARVQMADLGVESVEWLISAGACPICEELAAGGPYALDDEENLPPAHPNCIADGTLVSGPAILASTTRWYVGDVVDIQTAGGRLLTVTPNHPVLTSEGWVAAGMLHEGGDVICGSGGESAPPKVCPDHYQIPALIEQVAAAVGRARRGSAATVPTTTEDFHGDGGGSEICVIRTNGALRNALNAPLFQPFADQFFARRDAEPSDLPGLGAPAFGLEAVRSVPPARMSEAGQSSPFLGRSPGGEAGLNRTALMLGNAVRNQNAVNDGPAAIKVPSQRELILAGEIETDQLIFIKRRVFSGHVYNLQTARGWFLANGIITHNCLCSVSPVVDAEADSSDAAA